MKNRKQKKKFVCFLNENRNKQRKIKKTKIKNFKTAIIKFKKIDLMSNQIVIIWYLIKQISDNSVKNLMLKLT